MQSYGTVRHPSMHNSLWWVASPLISRVNGRERLSSFLINQTMIPKEFYRVSHQDTHQGVWYDITGNFTGLIHKEFNFCKNSNLAMDYDTELVGYLSATTSLEDLYQWFPIEDIRKLQEYGWFIHKYKSADYKFYERFQHEVINQDTMECIEKIVI